MNICENRLIKRALLFAERIVGKMLDQGQRSAVMLQGRGGSTDVLPRLRRSMIGLNFGKCVAASEISSTYKCQI